MADANPERQTKARLKETPELLFLPLFLLVAVLGWLMVSAKVKARNSHETHSMSAAYWRINPVALIGAAVAVMSVFLPWWGISTPVLAGFTDYRRWGLWNPPSASVLRNIGRPLALSAASTSQVFAIGSVLVLVLVLVAASLALAGSLTMHRSLLTTSLAISILTPISYAAVVSYVTSQYCIEPLSRFCLTGIGGNGTTIEGLTSSWGFETGFYAFFASIIVLGLGIYMNNNLMRTAATHRAEIAVPTSQPAK